MIKMFTAGFDTVMTMPLTDCLLELWNYPAWPTLLLVDVLRYPYC